MHVCVCTYAKSLVLHTCIRVHMCMCAYAKALSKHAYLLHVCMWVGVCMYVCLQSRLPCIPIYVRMCMCAYAKALSERAHLLHVFILTIFIHTYKCTCMYIERHTHTHTHTLHTHTYTPQHAICFTCTAFPPALLPVTCSCRTKQTNTHIYTYTRTSTRPFVSHVLHFRLPFFPSHALVGQHFHYRYASSALLNVPLHNNTHIHTHNNTHIHAHIHTHLNATICFTCTAFWFPYAPLPITCSCRATFA